MSDTGMNYEQKLARSMIKLRMLRPFYSSLYESMDKKCVSSISTMGVTTNTLYYNKDFIERTPFEELMFINLHEIGHVALMHVYRRENRDPELWNVACDLYVNQSLVKEFGLEIGKDTYVSDSIIIKAPESGCYCNSINLDKDYVERIYDELFNQGKANGYFSNNSGEFEFKFTGSNYTGNSINTGYWKKDPNRNYDTFSIKIKRDNNGSNYSKDLIDNEDDQASKEQQSRKILSDAVVRSEMLGKMVGDGSGNIERIVKNLLKSHLNWKKLFKKYLIQITSTDSSFLKPDKRMYYQDAIYPGQAAEESNEISIKICIDTSGSISSDDMSRFYYQVYDILKKFKVDAELVYWDSEVKSIGSIKTFGEFERVDCYGGGGTNPRVVFDYFSSKKEKPKVILMFTDGYFYDNWSEDLRFRNYKDTIWIMTKDYNKDFKPPFGRLAIAEFCE